MIGDSLRTRRKLVGLFATAAGALGLGLSRAPAAMAANGDPLVLGQNNSASAPTLLDGDLQLQTLHVSGQATLSRVQAGSDAGNNCRPWRKPRYLRLRQFTY
jgi:hypothetical protein